MKSLPLAPERSTAAEPLAAASALESRLVLIAYAIAIAGMVVASWLHPEAWFR